MTTMDRKIHGSGGVFPDLPHIIQSIQRLEGNPDCFGTAGGSCDRLDCKWRGYCIKEPESRLQTADGGRGNEGFE